MSEVSSLRQRKKGCESLPLLRDEYELVSMFEKRKKMSGNYVEIFFFDAYLEKERR